MNKLKEYRKEFKITQEHLADVLGCSRETYIRYETRDDMPSLGAADLLARFFGVTIYDLWPELQSSYEYEFKLKSSYLDGRHDSIDAMLSYV